MEKIYHVVTDKNLGDLPTRPDKVDISDVGPLSSWHAGLDWMRDDLSKAVEDKILTPLNNLSQGGLRAGICIQEDKGYIDKRTLWFIME